MDIGYSQVTMAFNAKVPKAAKSWFNDLDDLG